MHNSKKQRKYSLNEVEDITNKFSFDKSKKDFYLKKDFVHGAMALMSQNEILITALKRNTESSQKFNLIAIWLSIGMIVLASVTLALGVNGMTIERNRSDKEEKLLIKIDSSINELNKTIYISKKANSKKSINKNLKDKQKLKQLL